jgi:hypothetical protein
MVIDHGNANDDALGCRQRFARHVTRAQVPSRDVSRGETHQPSSLICTAKFRSSLGTKEEQIRGFEVSNFRGHEPCPSRPSLSRRVNYGHQADYITDASRLDTAQRRSSHGQVAYISDSSSKRSLLFESPKEDEQAKMIHPDIEFSCDIQLERSGHAHGQRDGQRV